MRISIDPYYLTTIKNIGADNCSDIFLYQLKINVFPDGIGNLGIAGLLADHHLVQD